MCKVRRTRRAELVGDFAGECALVMCDHDDLLECFPQHVTRCRPLTKRNLPLVLGDVRLAEVFYHGADWLSTTRAKQVSLREV